MSTRHFQITEVKALRPYCPRLIYGDGKTFKVDLSDWIDNSSTLAALKDPELFVQAKVGFGGHSVEWIEDQLELGADNLRNLGIEQKGGIGHERIWRWLSETGLTLEEAPKK